MARVKGAMMTRKHRNKVLGLAKGYWGNKSRHFKMANEQVMKSGRYAYVGRKQKKRDFRQLWITRISAGCKANGMNYSTFMHGLKLAGIDMNRKMLSETASSRNLEIHKVFLRFLTFVRRKNCSPVCALRFHRSSRFCS